jgi:hypothetical protein
MSDYPDWQAFANAQSDNLFSVFSASLSAGTYDTDILPALSWSSIIIIVSATAGAAQILISHYADAAGTEVIDSDSWPVNANTALRVRSPLRGKFVRLTITVTSGVNMDGQFWANFLSATSDRLSFPVSQQNMSDFNHSLAASATKTYDIGEICAGQAYWYFKPRDASGKLAVTLFSVDELGNPGQLVADFGTPTALTSAVIMVPDLIIRVQVTNNDGAAAHSYDFSLTVPPQ